MKFPNVPPGPWTHWGVPITPTNPHLENTRCGRETDLHRLMVLQHFHRKPRSSGQDPRDIQCKISENAPSAMESASTAPGPPEVGVQTMEWVARPAFEPRRPCHIVLSLDPCCLTGSSVIGVRLPRIVTRPSAPRSAALFIRQQKGLCLPRTLVIT